MCFGPGEAEDTRRNKKLGTTQSQQALNQDQNSGGIRSDKIQLNLITEAVVSF